MSWPIEYGGWGHSKHWGSAEPYGESMPGVSEERQGDQCGWRKQGRARVVGDDISEVREDQIRKSGGALGRLWIFLGNGSPRKVWGVQETCCDSLNARMMEC